MLRDFPLACSFQFFTLDSRCTLQSAAESSTSRLSILYIGFAVRPPRPARSPSDNFQFFTLDSRVSELDSILAKLRYFQFFTLDSSGVVDAYRDVYGDLAFNSLHWIRDRHPAEGRPQSRELDYFQFFTLDSEERAAAA